MARSIRHSRIQYVLPSALATMATANRTPAYLSCFDAFTKLIQAAMDAKHGLKGTAAKGKAIMVFMQQGRNLDKVMFGHVKNGQPTGKPTVLFFVDIKSGNIFGPKSDIAPNLSWWYGTLLSLDAWDFTDPSYPVPRDPSQFRAVKSYGGHTHYVPKGAHKRLSDKAKTKAAAKQKA